MKVPPVRLAPNQKVKTWKFAAKYLWKERFTDDKAELGRWTKDELLELGPTFVKIYSKILMRFHLSQRVLGRCTKLHLRMVRRLL